MRLPAQYVDAIKTATREAFGPHTVVRLFGSRVHDHLRGGDIDLHFEVDPDHGTNEELDRFERHLFQRIEPQRVDKIFTVRGDALGPFEQIAYRDGVIL